MSATRSRAAVAGALYLVTHVTSVAALALYRPLVTDPVGYLSGAAGPGDGAVVGGALLEALLALSVVGTAVTLYPVLRRHGESLALGHVGLRVLEAALICVGITSLLAVVALRRAGDVAGLGEVARGLCALHDATFLLGPSLVLGVSTVLVATLLFRSRLVPRPIAVLGLVGGPLVLGSAVAVLTGVYDQVSAWGAVTAAPAFAWELSLALWLVTRGFRPVPTPV